jgi:hypothetical protein
LTPGKAKQFGCLNADAESSSGTIKAASVGGFFHIRRRHKRCCWSPRAAKLQRFVGIAATISRLGELFEMRRESAMDKLFLFMMATGICILAGSMVFLLFE